ncbi:MAG: hypothetical protein ACRDPO_34310, partial [Streptosporangiaceae bacterium]
ISLVSMADVQGTPLAELSVADFERPVLTALRATFITAEGGRAAHDPAGLGGHPDVRRLR